MKVTTRSSYTVRALIDLARHSNGGTPVRLSEISEREGISHAYLEQLFNRLKKAQLVQGRKGPGGGYVLNRNPDGIRMGDVIRAVEGEDKGFPCAGELDGHQECPRRPFCTSHQLWDQLSAKMHACLNSVSLSELLKENRKAD